MGAGDDYIRIGSVLIWGRSFSEEDKFGFRHLNLRYPKNVKQAVGICLLEGRRSGSKTRMCKNIYVVLVLGRVSPGSWWGVRKKGGEVI